MDRDDMKNIVIHYPEAKHKTVTLYVGDTSIIDKHRVVEQPVIVEPTLKEKITKVVFGDETSNSNS